MAEDNLIFISIAAYRDPQLLPTILDCLGKASNPERLRFGICWQRDAEDPLLPLGDGTGFRVIDVDWRESRGACWARAEIMKLWRGEDWFLQVDSHCRFAKDWDVRLLGAMTQTGSPKPVLSTYAAPFTPGPNEVLKDAPLQMVLQGFTAEGIPQLKPAGFTHPAKAERPPRARFLAAGFLFAQGRFVEEVPYDPELYFMGEESAMTIRAFTHGYDLFHPAETLVWHDYLRAESKKHWGDHTESQVMRPWNQLDEVSRGRVQRLLAGQIVGRFGLGRVRTLADYEAYAGLSFRLRKAQQSTMRGEEPPNPEAPVDWADQVYSWIARVRVNREQLGEGALAEAALWSVAILDEQGLEICRRDLSPEELAPLQSSEPEIAVICEFFSETVPHDWTILPMSRSKGWLGKIRGRLLDGDFAVLKEDADDSSD